MKNRNRLIMGTAIGLAVIATAIDHTRHRVPTAEVNTEQSNIIIEGEENTSPCSMGRDENTSPCSMTTDDSSTSPCSLGD
jgi:hypothetical protein